MLNHYTSCNQARDVNFHVCMQSWSDQKLSGLVCAKQQRALGHLMDFHGVCRMEGFCMGQ